jgi:hypothetical protein
LERRIRTEVGDFEGAEFATAECAGEAQGEQRASRWPASVRGQRASMAVSTSAVAGFSPLGTDRPADAAQDGAHGLAAGRWFVAGELVAMADCDGSAADGGGLEPCISEPG